MDSVVHVPVRLSAPAPRTVIVEVQTVNGSGDDRAIEGANYVRTRKTLIFRIGDPLVQTVAIPIKRMNEGQHFKVSIPVTPAGARRANSSATVTATANAPATPPRTAGFRDPLTFQPKRLRFEMTAQSLKHSANGGPAAFATQLQHGRTQSGNRESGLYVDDTFEGIEPPLYIEGDDIVLHSQEFASPISYDNQSWRHGATVLSGYNTTRAQISNGQYEWFAQMPNRRGSWPALWLVSADGWPPELDVYEGYGYNNEYDFSRHLSHAFHGGEIEPRTFSRGVTYDAEAAYSLSGFDSGFHHYAIDINDVFITWFVDGIEVFQSVNPFVGETWYPIMNIAVKDKDAYTGGSGDMRIRSFRVYTD